MQKFIGASLRTRLYLLVLTAFIPVAMLILYITEEQKDLEAEAIVHKTVVLARAAANEENQQLESARNLLSALADMFLLIDNRSEELPVVLSNLLGHSTGYANFGITGPDGHVLASADPAAQTENYSNRSWFEDCLQRKEWTMGPYQGERINGKPVLYFAIPVRDRGRRTVAVAFAALNLNWMNRTVFKLLAELPKGSRLTLLDENHGMLRYTVNTGQWSVPKHFDSYLRRRLAGRGSGTLSGVDEAGEDRIYAFAPVTSSYRNGQVTMVLEIPRNIAFAASRRLFIRNVGLLLASALIAVAAIWWAGNAFVLRRVRAMVAASRKLAAGDLNARIGRIGVHDELSHLAGVFDEMAASLQKRIEHEARVMVSLEKSREQLRKLGAYQEEVREQERIRIAREIHDQLGQSLTILKMDLAWLKKQIPVNHLQVVEKLGSMAGVIDEALRNLHAVTAELRPVILDDFGLAAAIEWQIEELRSRSGLDCELECNGFEPDLPKDQATALFRIFQETLTNIVRHAHADQVKVCLGENDGELELDVQDNGRGITEDEINDPKSFGLLGMRERLYPWDGRIGFEGRPGRGTRVMIRLPMRGKGMPK